MPLDMTIDDVAGVVKDQVDALTQDLDKKFGTLKSTDADFNTALEEIKGDLSKLDENPHIIRMRDGLIEQQKSLTDAQAELKAAQEALQKQTDQIEARSKRIGAAEGKSAGVTDHKAFWKQHHVMKNDGSLKGYSADDADYSAEMMDALSSAQSKMFKNFGTPESMMISLSDAERKALHISDNSQAGFTVKPELSSEIIRCQEPLDGIRSLVRVINTSSKELEFMTMGEYGEAFWECDDQCRAEKIEMPENGTTAITAHRLSGHVCIASSLLEDSSIDIENQIIAPEVAAAFTKSEDKAILTGDGIKKPNGILNSKSGVKSVQSTTAGCITTDDIINTFYCLNQQYRGQATWGIHDDAMRQVAGLKDGLDRPIYLTSLTATAPSTLMGRPVRSLSEMPQAGNDGQYATGDVMALLGDWQRGYYMTNRQGFQVFRNPFIYSGLCIVWTFTQRMGGRVMCPSAFKALKSA